MDELFDSFAKDFWEQFWRTHQIVFLIVLKSAKLRRIFVQG